MVCFYYKQKTTYEMRISYWSSDVGASDLSGPLGQPASQPARAESVAVSSGAGSSSADARQPRGPGGLDPYAAGGKSRAGTGRCPGLASSPGGGTPDPGRGRADRVS